MRRVLKGCSRFKFTVTSECRSKSLRTGNPRLQGLVLCARQRIRRLLCCYFLTCLGKLPVIRSRTEYLAHFWKYFWLFLIFLDLCCVEVARVKLLETDWGPKLYFLASIFNWLRDYMLLIQEWWDEKIWRCVAVNAYLHEFIQIARCMFKKCFLNARTGKTTVDPTWPILSFC